ncbi:MAG: hypothetical protein K9M99_00415 [Candidatus Cloacimonetes bacterium]|nr:hypothetical protein [Candidatus Cloacimonadota bacterium]
MKNIILFVLLSLLIVTFIGCDAKNGTILEYEQLPTDSTLTLYSENEGIYPDTNVLNDPENPYANTAISMDSVWVFNDNCPSPKAKFYLWATMLARITYGEYQYMTAQALHELYTAGGSENARNQAIKAYRATLDHFFDSVTWWQWNPGDPYHAVLLRELAADFLYDPIDNGRLPLYTTPAKALADISEWGYVYNPDTGVVSRRN